MFYRDIVKSAIEVDKKIYDANGNEITDNNAAHKYVYTIKVIKMLPGLSTSSITWAKLLSTATAKIELPTDVQVSGTPMSGKFKVKCVDKNN